LTVIVVSFFESVFADHSKDHPMAVAYLSSDTLTGIRTPLCWTPLQVFRAFVRAQVFIPPNPVVP